MKKLMSIVLALCMALSLCTTAWAADVSTETELLTAITNAAAGDTIKLTADIKLEKPVLVSKKLTIDLAGHSITPAGTTLAVNTGTECKDALIIVQWGGDLTINDSEGGGKIDTGNNKAIFSAVKMTLAGDTATGTAKLTVNGGTLKGYYYAICGNGTRHGTEITINGGTLTGYAANDHYAIFHPQEGTLTINGGTLEGTTGIEMRAGTLTVNGGTIKSNGTTYKVEAKNSGSTTWGAAVAVAEHNTAKGVTVNIKGGTIEAGEGAKALSVADPQSVSNTAHPVTVNITGGSVSGAIEQTNAFGNAKPTTITGGTFDTDVTEFVPVDTAVAKDENGNHYVGSDSIADAANSGKDMTMVQGGPINGLEPGAHIIVPKDVTGTTLNGEAAEWGDYTIADPNTYQHKPIRRQHTTTTVEDTATTPDTKADDTTKADTVTSAKTFDAGVAVYGMMAVASVLGMGYVGKKKEF